MTYVNGERSTFKFHCERTECTLQNGRCAVCGMNGQRATALQDGRQKAYPWPIGFVEPHA